jgi:hypothetical protein
VCTVRLSGIRGARVRTAQQGLHVPSEDLDEQRILRRYRQAFIGLAFAWRTILVVGIKLPETTDLAVAAVLVLYVWGLVPYLALAALAAEIRHRHLSLSSSVLLLVGDVMSGIGVLRPGSSTDAVALLTYPFLATFGLIPITWLVSWLLNR